jgi:hypothetical protein
MFRKLYIKLDIQITFILSSSYRHSLSFNFLQSLWTEILCKLPRNLIKSNPHYSVIEGTDTDRWACDGLGEGDGGEVDEVVSGSEVVGVRELLDLELEIWAISGDVLVALSMIDDNGLITKSWFNFQYFHLFNNSQCSAIKIQSLYTIIQTFLWYEHFFATPRYSSGKVHEIGTNKSWLSDVSL